MDIKLMQPGQEQLVIDIVKKVFNEFVAPQYSKEGITEFHKYANEKNLSERSKSDHFTFLAQIQSRTIGILEIRDLGHISMFFVLPEHQKKGIGRKLLKEAVAQIRKQRESQKDLTVNSSPNSVSAYKRFGFAQTGDEQCTHGIRYVPMTLSIDPNNKN